MAKHFLLSHIQPSLSYHHKHAKTTPVPLSLSYPARTSPRRSGKPQRDKTYSSRAGNPRGELLTAVAALATLVQPVLAKKTDAAAADVRSDALGAPRPDVPEFLCPALATQHSAASATSATTAHPYASQDTPNCWVTHHGRQQQRRQFHQDSSDYHENSYQQVVGVRSSSCDTFFTASSTSFSSFSPYSSASLLAGLSFPPTHTHTHDDRPPFSSEPSNHLRETGAVLLEVEEDVESDSYSNADNANAKSNTAFAHARHISSNHNNNNKDDSDNSQLLSNPHLFRQDERKKRRRDFPNSKQRRDDDGDYYNNNEESADSSASSVPTTSSVPASSSTQCSELYTSRTIPDRYELGNDGRWHKLSVSSSCLQCDCQTSHDVDDSANTDISATGVVNNDTSYDADGNPTIPSAGFTSSGPSSDSNGVTIVLPDGWDRDFNSVVYQVPLIVIASLLLAAAVTGAVWFTFFFRRRQRMARKLALQRDLEKRKRVEEGGDSGDEDDDDDGDGNEDARGRVGGAGGRGGRRAVVEGNVEGRKREKTSEEKEKAKARWARATAQWKAHVRWIHRRRRGRASIMDGMKQRDAAMASGVSLARSVASVPSSQSQLQLPLSENNNASTSGGGGGSGSPRSGSRSRYGESRTGSADVSSEARPVDRVGEPSGEQGLAAISDVEDEVAPQTAGFRVRGTRDRRVGNVVPGEEPGPSSRATGPLSEGRRSVSVSVVEPRDLNQQQPRTRLSRRQRRRQESFGRREEVVDERFRETGEDGEVEDDALRRSGSSRSLRGSRLHSEVDFVNGPSMDDRALTASSSFASPSVPAAVTFQDPWAPRGEYDRPPPELCPVERAIADGDERQDPPAYRSRRSVEGANTRSIGLERRVTRRRRGRRRVRDEKIATAVAPSGSGFVLSPEDYAPYSSSSETEGDGDVEDAEIGSGRSSVQPRAGVREQTSMHVAVDDKQALARLATYASAPPMHSPPPPHPSYLPSSTTPSSRPSSSSLHTHASVPVEPNAPPEPEWERFEEYEYGDTPGAGPGPSTVSARSRSASPSSSPSSLRRAHPQSRSQSSFFPAPPEPIPSKLAYAPAEAGLVHPSPPPVPTDSEDGYSYYTYGYGYGARDFNYEFGDGLDLETALGPSAPPPFSAGGGPPPAEFGEDLSGDVRGVDAPSAPPEDDFLDDASAPPLLEEEEGVVAASPNDLPSAPPLGDDDGSGDHLGDASKNSLNLTGVESVGESSLTSSPPERDGPRVEIEGSSPMR